MAMTTITPSYTLNVHSIQFQFDSRTIFDNWSGQFEAGISWVRGTNGAGKTTLLKLLGGALLPYRGTIQLGTLDSRKHPYHYRLQSYWCSGSTPQLVWLKVRELLEVVMSLYPAAKNDLLYEHLSVFGMHNLLSQTVGTLSLGQHKKLQLALALTLPVTLLLLDEPFNGLDSEATQHLRSQLADPTRLAQQIIVMTSHVDLGLTIAKETRIGHPVVEIEQRPGL